MSSLTSKLCRDIYLFIVGLTEGFAVLHTEQNTEIIWKLCDL